MGKQRPRREEQGKNHNIQKKLQSRKNPGFHGGMVDRLSSKVDEEVSGSVKGKGVLMVLPQKSHFNLILYFASINASQSHEHFPIARVCGEREDQRRGHHCALQGGFNIIITIIIIVLYKVALASSSSSLNLGAQMCF